MKKIYIAPETNIYKVNVVSMMATSFGTIEDTPDGDLELSREENTDNTFPQNSTVVLGYLPVKLIPVSSNGVMKRCAKLLLIDRAVCDDLQGVMEMLFIFQPGAE